MSAAWARWPDGIHRAVDPALGAVVIKRRSTAAADFFAAEAEGLAELAATGTLRVPSVHHADATTLVMEDLGSSQPAAAFWRDAGVGLARLHGHRGARFGFRRDGYCGPTPQANGWDQDGHRFFGEQRLLSLLRRCRDADALSANEARAVESIVQGLSSLVPTMPAVLLHGDLWLGNLHCCGDGTPALIDAGAVHYGWAEADLAMLTLFGEPPPAFWTAYAEAAPLAPDWRDRAPLYNLYHLLNHVLLFGAGYLPQTRAAIARYA